MISGRVGLVVADVYSSLFRSIEADDCSDFTPLFDENAGGRRGAIA